MFTAASGCLLAVFGVKHYFDPVLFISVLAGTMLIIASSCTINNYIDRGIDKKMSRTKKRALVTGEIDWRHALIFAAVLGIAGFAVLIWQTNWVTVLVGAVGVIDYVILYGIGKRKTVHGTLIGTVAGATSILAGYTAVTNRLDFEGLLLFLTMCAWQMPHFYAIAMFRLKDYKNAKIPVLPAVEGTHRTKIEILCYVAAFGLLSLSIGLLGYVGHVYLIVMLAISAIWFARGIKGFKTEDETTWAKKMFFFSLNVLLIFSVALPVGALLP